MIRSVADEAQRAELTECRGVQHERLVHGALGNLAQLGS